MQYTVNSNEVSAPVARK